MSDHKFSFITLVAKNNSFWEFESLENFIESEGREELENVLGYFPSKSNTTYDELKKCNENNNWIVCYQDKESGEHVIKTYHSTLMLRMELDNLINNSYRNMYINIYSADKFVYLIENEQKKNESMKYNSEELAKVAYIYGLNQEELTRSEELDWEDLITIFEKVATDWSNRVDIKSFEEEGYIVPYAERRLYELFGTEDQMVAK